MAENRVQSYLRTLNRPVQNVEQALDQLMNERALGTAIGAQLDLIGRMVGQARGGLSDDDYERYIRGRVRANRSSGTVDDILGVISLVLDEPGATLRLEQQPPAAFTLHAEATIVSPALASILMVFLRASSSAAVWALLHTFPVAEGDSFAFFDSADGAGYGDTSNPATGGGYSSIQE